MSMPTPIQFLETDLDAMAEANGRLVVMATPDGKLDQAARRANRLSKGAVARFVESEGFAKVKSGQVISLGWPAGMAAEALDILIIARNAAPVEIRKAGAKLAKLKGDKPLSVMAGNLKGAAQLALGIALRDYSFNNHKTSEKADAEAGDVTIYHNVPEDIQAVAKPLLAVAEGAHFTRDLVNEPANVLTTTEFANRLEEMKSLGLEVTVGYTNPADNQSEADDTLAILAS